MNFDPYVLQQRYKEGQGTSEKSVYSEAFHTPNTKKPAPVQHGDQTSKGTNTPPISKLTSKIQGFFHMDHNKSEEKPKSGASTPGVREPGMPTDLSKYKAKNAPTPFVNTAANPQKSASTSGMASIPGTLPKVEEAPSPQPKKNDEVKTPSQPQQNTNQQIKQNPTPNLVDDLISTSPPKQNATISPQGYQQTNENKFNQSPKLQNQPVYNPYMAQYSQSQVANRTSQPLDILSDLPAPAMLPNSPQQPKMSQNSQSPNLFGGGAKSVDPFATPLQNRQNDIFGNATPPQQPKQKEVTKQFDIFSTNHPTSQKKSNDSLATFEIFGVPPMSPPGQNNFSSAPTQQQNVKQTPPQPKAPIDILPPAQKKSHNGNSHAPVDQHKFDEFDPLKSQNVTKPPQKPAPQQQKAPVQQQPPAQKPVQAKQPQQTLHTPTVTKNADNLTPSPKPNPSPQPQKVQQQPVKDSPLKAEQKQAKPELQTPQKVIPVTEAPIQSLVKEVPVTEAPIQSPAKEVPAQSPVQEVQVTEAPVQLPVKDVPVQYVPVQSPVQEVPVQSPVQEVPVQSPVQEAPVAQPEQNAEPKPEEQVVDEIKPAEERSGETLLSSQPHEECLLYNPFGQPAEQSQPQETKEEEPKQDALAFNPFAQQQPQPEPVENEDEPKQDALTFNPFNETQPAQEEKQEEPKKDVLSYNPFNDYQPEEPKPELENLPPAYGMFAQQQQQPVEQKQEEPKSELYNPFGGEQKPAQQEGQKQKEEAVMFDPFAGEQKQVQQVVEEVKPAQNQQQNSYNVFAQPQVPAVEQHQQQVDEKPKEELYNPFGETKTTVEVAVENKQQEDAPEPVQAVENNQQNSYDLFGQPATPQEPVVQQQETNLYNPFDAPPQPVEPEPVVSREVELGGDLLDHSNQQGDDEIPIQNEVEQAVQDPAPIPPSSPINMSAPLAVEVTDSSSFEEPPHEEGKNVVNAQPTLETVKEEPQQDALLSNQFNEQQPNAEAVPEPAISFNPFGNAQPEPVKQEEPKTDALAFNPFAQTETLNTEEPVKEEEPKVDALAFNPFAQQEAQPVKEEEPQIDALLSNPFNETSTSVAEPVSEPVNEEPKTDEVKVDATISFNPFGNTQPEPSKEEEQKFDALAFNPFNASEAPATVEEPSKEEEPQVDALASNLFNEPQEEVKTEAPAVEVSVQQPEEPKQDALAFNPFSQTEPQPEPVQVEEEPKQDALAFNPFASSAPAEETKPVSEEPKVDALAFNPFSEAQQPASEEKHEEVKVETTEPQPEEPKQDALASNPFSASLAETVKQEEPKTEEKPQQDPLAFNPFGETQQPASEEIKGEKHETVKEEPKADALAFNPFTQSESANVEEPVKEEEHKQDALLSNPFGETQPSAEEKHEEATEQKSDAIAFNPFSQQEAAKEEPTKEETAVTEVEEAKEVHIIPPPEVPVEGDEHTLPRAPSIHLVPSESSSVDNFEKYDPFSKVIRERSVELDISDDSMSTTTESEVHRSTQSNPVFSDHIESISKNKSHNNLSLKAPAEIDLDDFNNYVKSVLPQKEIVGQRVTPKKVIRRHKTKSAGPAGFDSLVEDKLSSNVQTDFNPFGNQVEKKHEDPKDALMFNPFGEDGTSATPAAAPFGVGSPVIKRPPPIPHAVDDDDDTNRSRKRLDFNPLTAPKKKKKSKKIIVEPVFNPFKDKDKSMVKSNSQHMIVGERFNNDIDRELKFLRTDNRMERVENSPFDVSPQEPIKNFDQTIAARVLTKFCNEHFNQPAAFRF